MKGIAKLLPVFAIASVLFVAGCTAGDKVLEDGTVVKSDGTMVKPDGTMVAPDGTMTAPDGTMTKPDGTMIKPDGTMIKPDGTMIGPDGQMIEDAMMEKNDSMMEGEEGAMMEKNESAMMEKNGTAMFSSEGLTELANNFYRYDPVEFQHALDDGKIVFLSFRANWCPVCNAERPAILEGLNSINYDDVVGFEVHYNDVETMPADNELIQKYQVAYQHTKIIIGRDGNVALPKTLDVFDKDRVVSEIENARNA